MQRETFDWIWAQINNTAHDILHRLDPNQQRKDFKMTHSDMMGKAIIWDEYNKIRKDLKNRCYSKLIESDGSEELIDHHKIGACLCKALIRKKLFTFHMDENTSEEILRSNYELAYTVSLRIVYVYMIYSLSTYGNPEQAKKLEEWKTLRVPRTTRSHDDYNMGRIKMLALNDFYHTEFDLLSYADMLFWLEHYNRQLLADLVDVEFEDTREASSEK